MKVSDPVIDVGNGQMVKNPFAEVLQAIADEQERNAVIAALGKTAQGQEVLRQLAVRADNGEKYAEYYTGDRETLRARAEAAERELQSVRTAAPASRTEVPPKLEEFDLEDLKFPELMAKVEADLRGKGFISRADAEVMAEQKAREAAARTLVYLNTKGLPAVESYVQAPQRYREEFSKDMDVQAFKTFVAQNNYSDIGRAYQDFTHEARLDKIKADAFAAGELSGTKKASDEFQKQRQAEELRRMPTDMAGGAGLPRGSGELPAETEVDKKVGADYQLGRKGGFKLAHAVAEQIAKDRAAGKVL